jgi:hypothetical protein
LPPRPTSYVSQIIELSRQRYTVERAVVEKIIRESIEGKLQAPRPQPALPAANNDVENRPDAQVARPKAQAQLNQLAHTTTANASNKVASTLIKAVTGGASGTNESASMQVQQTASTADQTNSEQPVKKKRTRRGGRKNKKKNQSAQPQQPIQQPGTTEIKPHRVEVQATPQIRTPEPEPQQKINEETIIKLR